MTRLGWACCCRRSTDRSGGSSMPQMNPTKHSKAVYDACRVEDWEKVIALCSCEAPTEGTADFKVPYEDKDGRTCLHAAVYKRAPCRVIRAILDAHKKCPVRITRITDEYDQTALHTVADRFSGSYDEAAVLQMLLESDPHCATMRDEDGHTPLHCILSIYSCENDEERAILVECTRALLNANTTESILLHTDKYNETVLHAVCSCSAATPEVLKMILEHCPQAAFAKDSHGNTPLHTLARTGDFCDFNCANIVLLLESLTMQGQSGAAALNNDGQTPLHLAVCCAHKNATKMLIDSLPESVYIQDKDGMTPLDRVQEAYTRSLRDQWREHLMAARSCSQFTSCFKHMCEVSSMLAEAMLSMRHRRDNLTAEESLKVTTEQKSDIKEDHLECGFVHNYLRLGPECPLHSVLFLLTACPHHAQMKDARGDLPLHVALENGVQHAKFKTFYSYNRRPIDINGNGIITTLIDAYPQAARIPNRNGDLPFHILVQNRADEIGWYYSVQPLLRTHPAALLYEETDLLPVLLPLILSRVGEGKDLSTLYEFVREIL